MKIKIMIVDDEPLAIKVLVSYVNRIETLALGAQCRSATEAFNALQKEHYDLMFLDIQMPELSGLDFLKSLNDPPKVIFTTAYKDYAVESYELEALDYLLKPISFDRFLKSINKILLPYQGLSLEDPLEDQQAFIYLKSDKKVFKVRLNDIVYVESLKDYIKVHTHDHTIITYQTISNFCNILPANKFLRIHRSYIIALDKINFFNSTLVAIAEQELPIGRTYKDSVLNTLNIDSIS